MAHEFHKPHPIMKPDNKRRSSFDDAERIHNDRLGQSAVRERNWRIAFVGSMGVTAIAVLGLIYQSTKSHIEPYYVRINSDGYTQAMPVSTVNKISPQLNEIRYFLSQFVSNIRSIPMDVVVAKDNYTQAYAFLTNIAATTLQEYYAKEQNPALLLGKQTTTVHVIAILPKSKDSYQVDWQEETFSLDGRRKDSCKYTGLFTVAINPPSDEKTLYQNPIGLYIRSFSWTKSLQK